jgi:hypothetical protein
MLGLVPPHGHGEERCLLVPPTADGHPEPGPGDPTLGVADLGLVGEVAGFAGTLATAAGGSLREVMDRLGHSTTVAAVRYQHVMADRDAAIARELTG